MKINFKKVILHNFGSYNHAEVQLENLGICKVSGKNYFKKDNALSNGSGKSFIWSAICYAITGETIDGLKFGLKNIYIDEPESYVELYFHVDKDDYYLKRIISPKSDLLVYKNGEDISGKGLRESEKRLAEILPDLTKTLIASTIIVGQGMPAKFSSFSPVGRKELLEKLTKSDYMIEDIKTRLVVRLNELSAQIREHDDKILILKTKLNAEQLNLQKIRQEKENLKPTDYSEEIKIIKENIQTLTIQSEDLTTKRAALTEEINKLNSDKLAVLTQKANEQSQLSAAFTEATLRTTKQLSAISADIKVTNAEISKINSIKEVCPTCGRPFENINKPDTTPLKEQLARLNETYNKVKVEEEANNQKNNDYLKLITEKYANQLATVSTNLNSKSTDLVKLDADLKNINDGLSKYNTKLSGLEYKMKFDAENYNKIIIKETEALENINNFNSELTATNNSLLDLQQHVGVLKKLDSVIKRDFRGYLLEDIIKFLDSRAKDFCEIVFGTRDLRVYLDGTALDITYNGKIFDCLSGGEKQRVDLILQFAIRDMLSSYLGYSANILVLDEVTDFLDKQSCKAILDLIISKVTSVESIFIISHHSTELELPVDSELNIIKTEDGISKIKL